MDTDDKDISDGCFTREFDGKSSRVIELWGERRLSGEGLYCGNGGGL